MDLRNKDRRPSYLSQRNMRVLNCLRFLLAEIMFLTSLSRPAKIEAVEMEIWLWTRLFLCFYRKKTMAWVATLRMSFNSEVLAALIQDKSSDQLVRMLVSGRHLMNTSFHTSRPNSHASNIWSLVSLSLEQKGHVVVIGNPQEASLSLVGNLSQLATHIANACFSTDPLNHTTLTQSFTFSRGRKTSGWFKHRNWRHPCHPFIIIINIIM